MYDTLIICFTIFVVSYVARDSFSMWLKHRTRQIMSEGIPDIDTDALLKRVEDLEKFESEAKSKLNALTIGAAFKV